MEEKEYLRHKRMHKLLRAPFAFLMWLVLGLRTQKLPEIPGPFIVLSNHTTGWDQYILAIASRKYVYFVGSEHTLRLGLVSKLLKRYFPPVERLKGGVDASTIAGMIQKLKQGKNICLFPEGERTFTGVTAQLHPTTGKLIKMLNVPIITYRLTGGYLTDPRWGKGIRKGKMRGEVINVYTAEQLRKLSAPEITNHLIQDLHEDAFARQQDNPVAFRARKLACHMPEAFYVCPACGKIDTIQAKGNLLFCACGLAMEYTPYGRLVGQKLAFTNTQQWDEMQNTLINAHLRKCTPGQPIYTDDDQILREILPTHNVVQLGTGNIALYHNRLCICGMEFPIEKIVQMAMYHAHKMELITFSADGVYYEIASTNLNSRRKYVQMYNLLKALQ